MKANAREIERALDRPPAEIRLFLLHGPDEAGSRALAQRLARAMGADAERIDLDSGVLRSDPARLADEAASISLFGGARYILATGGDEALAAVEALLGAPSAGNPAILVAGTLRSSSALLKRALARPDVMAFASYAPEGADAERVAANLAREQGLRVEPDVARRIAAMAGGDRAIMAREIEKLALYLDAAPERPADADAQALDAVGADMGEGDVAMLVNAVMGGRPAQAAAETARLASEGVDGIALIRPALRRVALLTRLRAEVDRGASPDAAIAAAGGQIFWKEKAEIARELSRWSAERLANAHARLVAAERGVKASGSAGEVIVGDTLGTIARAAARGR